MYSKIRFWRLLDLVYYYFRNSLSLRQGISSQSFVYAQNGVKNIVRSFSRNTLNWKYPSAFLNIRLLLIPHMSFLVITQFAQRLITL